ncbi:MAG TPA: RNA methyltransferase [Nitrospiraceae bacterium]|nr:RNA methyltransferase [Nitrospiraceae bacterium]
MRYIEITSRSNPHIREAVTVKGKRPHKYDAFLIEGPHLLQMAFQARIVIQKIFFTEEYLSTKEGTQLLRQISRTGAELFRINRHILSRLSDTETPQGIVAMASCRPLSLDELRLRDPALLIVIDGVQDPGNLGTIIRTSDAAGVDALILLPGTCDVFMPKVLRATAGSIFNVPLVYSETGELMRWLQEKSIKALVTDVKASQNLYEADLTQPLAFVFGHEATGVTEKLKRQADVLVKIPLFGEAESLNVAISAAICMYEAVRQRTAKKNQALVQSDRTSRKD